MWQRAADTPSAGTTRPAVPAAYALQLHGPGGAVAGERLALAGLDVNWPWATQVDMHKSDSEHRRLGSRAGCVGPSDVGLVGRNGLSSLAADVAAMLNIN